MQVLTIFFSLLLGSGDKPIDMTTVNMALAIGYGTELPPPDDIGIGSRYGDPGDKWAGGPLACGDGEQTIFNSNRVCAHRFYPCGTVLIIETVRTRRRTWCYVMDRGPYGAMLDDEEGRRWVVKKRAEEPGTWRGIIDLGPDVSREMDHNGFERVRIWSQPRLSRIWNRARSV